LIRPGAKVLLVEDLVSTGSTLTLGSAISSSSSAGLVVGIGCLWRRPSVDLDNRPVFSLVSRDFPTYDPDKCPFCKRGVPAE
jgi:orotate phosphoribosyltransferase